MKIFVLFGQRIESYPGQYSPEALAVADEICYSDNPDYLLGELEKYEKSDDFTSLKIVPIDISSQKLHEILHPKIAPLAGDIAASS